MKREKKINFNGYFLWISLMVIMVFVISACAVPLSRINGDNETKDVIINCTPDNAKVFLDGVYIGKAKRFSTSKRPLKVIMGMHVLEFEEDGYQLELREIMTTPGVEVVKLKMKLRPVAVEDQ